jgi:hypothetical protein
MEKNHASVTGGKMLRYQYNFILFGLPGMKKL